MRIAVIALGVVLGGAVPLVAQKERSGAPHEGIKVHGTGRSTCASRTGGSCRTGSLRTRSCPVRAPSKNLAMSRAQLEEPRLFLGC